MADVKWIKIVTDIFDDEKILLIEAMPEADSLITIWFKLLCLAGKQNNSGVFMLNDRIPYTDEMFATIFRRKLNTVRLALNTFEDLGMIEIIDGVVTIPKWGKHQSIEQFEARKEYMRQYNKQYYQRQKMLASGDSKTSVKQSDKSLNEFKKTSDKQNSSMIDKDIEEDKEKDKSIKRQRFTPPTLDEVKAYCEERGNKVDPQRFFEYYDAGNWIDGKGKPVKNWKQKVITWEQDNGTPSGYRAKPRKPMDDRTVTEADFGTGYYSDVMNRPRA